jgi:hypothetical protein
MSLQEILRIQNERKARVQTTYDKIFERVKIRINHSAKYGATSCYYDIPQLLYGLPSCDLKEAGTFVYKKLKKEGFDVHRVTDTLLIINWDVASISEKKAKLELAEREKQLEAVEQERSEELLGFLASTKKF